jgi:hypothetical protein
MKSLSLTLLVLAATSVRAVAGILAGPITNDATGHYYYLLAQNSWTASHAEALRLDGDLVTIDDQAEQDWVFMTFTASNMPFCNLWIGLNDLGHDGLFTWVSGENSEYRNWDVGEPNNGGQTQNESFVHMWAVGAPNVTPGRWNDLPDVTEYGGIPLRGVVEVDPTLHVSISVAYIELRWRSQTNHLYQVQYASDLTGNMWVDLGSPVPGNGTTNAVLASAQQSPRRFYRVTTLQ